MEALVLSMEAPAEGVAETLLALLVRRVPPILEALGMSGAETVLCGEPVEAERLLDEQLRWRGFWERRCKRCVAGQKLLLQS